MAGALAVGPTAMSQPREFAFGQARTCFIVGAGGSACLDYPSFCSESGVRAMIDAAIDEMGDDPFDPGHQERCRALAHLLAARYHHDLERVYEYLAHVPPDLSYPRCNTDFMCQYIVREIARRFREEPEPARMESVTHGWNTILDAYDLPVAIFTTNYESVIERVLTRLRRDYADGWSGDQYLRANFSTGLPSPLALVKLHGSADWMRAKQYTITEIRHEGPPVTVRPACLAPSRRKWHVEEPYASGYDFLEESLATAQSLIVLGFSWRDLSVATALRRALLARRSRPLDVHVYDPYPEVIEERIRRFLNESGSGGLALLLQWRHHAGYFPDVALARDSGSERGVLQSATSLAELTRWVRIPGEPVMVDEPAGGVFRIRWGDEGYYFESGRIVLAPSLPDEFSIDLRMVLNQYGSGWDPGIVLEDAQGDAVVCARFIQRGEVWRHENEPDVSGLRIAHGIGVLDRVEVAEGCPVSVIVRSRPVETVLSVKVQGNEPKQWSLPHDVARRPVRLHIGGYPWYSDEGIGGWGRATDCMIGPCTVTPV